MHELSRQPLTKPSHLADNDIGTSESSSSLQPAIRHFHLHCPHNQYHHLSSDPVYSGRVFKAMKSALVLATGLLGLADAGVHKMK